MSPRKTLDDIVFESGLTDILRLERARRESATRNVLLAATLIDLGYVDQHALADVVARVTGFPIIDPLPDDAASRLSGRLPSALAREAMAVPVALDGDVLTVAMLDPTLDEVIATLASTSGLTIVPAIAIRGPLESLVDRLYPEYQGEDITLMSGRSLSLDDGTPAAATGTAPQPSAPDDEPAQKPSSGKQRDELGTVMVPGRKRKSGDTTAPRGAARLRPLEIRVDSLETRLVDITRILADVQTRLDAIEARLRRLPNS